MLAHPQTVFVAGAFELFHVARQVLLQQEQPVPDLPAQRERQGVQPGFDFVGENDGVTHGKPPNRFHHRCQVEPSTMFARKAELHGEGRDCLEPVRRRVNPTTPPRAMHKSLSGLKQLAKLIWRETGVFGDAAHRHCIDRMVARDDEAGLAIRHHDVTALPRDAVAETLEDADGVALADARELGHRARP